MTAKCRSRVGRMKDAEAVKHNSLPPNYRQCTGLHSTYLNNRTQRGFIRPQFTMPECTVQNIDDYLCEGVA